MNTSPAAGTPASGTAENKTEAFDFTRQIPTPYRILGLALKPLSIGRYRRLAANGCAFVSETPARADIADLVLGVVCCSLTCEEFDTFATSPMFSKEIREWSTTVMPAPFLGRLAEWWPCKPIKWIYSVWSRSSAGDRWRKNNAINLAEKFELFRAYIAAAQEMPRYCARQAKETINTAHWCDNVEMTLRNQLGWTGQEIDEQPLSKALADYLNWAAANDLITIFSEEDQAQGDHNDAILEKAFSGRQDSALRTPHSASSTQEGQWD